MFYNKVLKSTGLSPVGKRAFKTDDSNNSGNPFFFSFKNLQNGAIWPAILIAVTFFFFVQRGHQRK